MAINIIVGTYEELTFGYKVNIVETSQDESTEPVLYFTDHSHCGMVRATASSSKGILATGSSDESIRLFNLKSKSELGILSQHDGGILHLSFHKSSHMFSTSDDGTVAVWKTGSWECLRILKGHKGPVYHFAVHPTGKLGLSISKDRTMKTWNLITMRCAYTTNIKDVADVVSWTPKGDHYVLVFRNKVDIYAVQTTSIVHTLQCSFAVLQVNFLDDDTLVVSGERGFIQLFSLKTGAKLHEISTETNRIKGLRVHSMQDETCWCVITGSSDGNIKVWKVKKSDNAGWEHSLLKSTKSHFRITCLTTWDEAEHGKNSAEGEDGDAVGARKKKKKKTPKKLAQPKSPQEENGVTSPKKSPQVKSQEERNSLERPTKRRRRSRSIDTLKRKSSEWTVEEITKTQALNKKLKIT